MSLLVQSKTIQKAKGMKALRLIRILKLMRILKALTLVKKYRAKFSLPLMSIFMLKRSISLMFMVHMFACIWLLTATMQCDDAMGCGDVIQ